MMFYGKKIMVYLLIEILLNLCENDMQSKSKATVAASGNSEISGPFLQIEKQSAPKISITKPHSEHFLHCKATIDESFYEKDDNPTFEHIWYRNGIALQRYSGRRNDFYLFNNGTLRLPPTEKAAGLYYCQVNANSIAVISDSITVDYPVLKRIPAPSNITAPIGRPFTFNCPVLSAPPANITWIHGNVSLAKKLKENRYIWLVNGSLVISKINAQDGGRYKCSAVNQFATKTDRHFIWTITVDDTIKTIPNYGQLVPQLQETTQYVPVGDYLKLLCYSMSDLVPIEWWYQRVPSAPVEKLSNFSNEYLIQHASIAQHDGYYTCSTPQDKQTFHVVVAIAPIIQKSLTSYESHIASSISFVCHAFGNPTPEITWYHNAIPINSSFTRNIAGNELRIHSFDPDEEGIYQCFARNIVGEASAEGEIRLKTLEPFEQPMENPLKNIRCYAHSSNTINVTFDRVSSPYIISVHIVQSNPHRWTSPAPLELNHSSYIVISNHFPDYSPFELITRALLRTTNFITGNHNPKEERIVISLRSKPVTCCTQGSTLHIVPVYNDTFVTWSQPDIKSKKYFILQFSSNFTQPLPQQLFGVSLIGTMTNVQLNKEDISRKLTEVQALNEIAAQAVLNRAESKYSNIYDNGDIDLDKEIFNLVVPYSVTGILLHNVMRVKMRVLIITAENENLQQDFRYVQWEIIENGTSETSNLPFRLTKIESRMVELNFQDSITERCVQVCHSQIPYPTISHEELMCEEREIINSQLEVRSLKPTKRYRLNFSSCKTPIFYGQVDVLTLADPPGTISNQRITKQNGLKLSWDPPVHSNGKIHHYNILWTVNNVTHEANVFECTECFYKFPHISETSKINITVRVLGENGIGAPIFIDLRDINHKTLVEERPTNSEVYSGIAIGAGLSALCIFFFALLIVCQRRRFKSRQQAPINLTSQSETNFGNLNTTGIPGDSAGALSGSTLQHEYHEMQTLIPKSRNMPLLNERPNEYQSTQLPNGNGNICRRQENSDQDTSITQSELDTDGHNLSSIPLFTSTPTGKHKDANVHLTKSIASKPYFIPFRQMPQSEGIAGLQKHSSSPNFQSCVSATPPTSLPLATAASVSNGHRSGSLSSSSGTSNGISRSSNGSSHRHFHTNFPKHSNSNDGICLLAEEESTATLTPTSETGVSTDVGSTNGYTTTIGQTTTFNCQKNENINTHTPNAASTSRSTITGANNNNNKTYKNCTTNAAIGKNPNMSIVPTMGPAMSTTTSTANSGAQNWASKAAATNLHRCPNVDPNG